MNVSVDTAPLHEVVADALVVGVHADEVPAAPALARLDEWSGGRLRAVLEAEKFQAKPGQVTHLHASDRLRVGRVVIVGLGPRADCTAETIRRATAAGVRRARDLGARTVAVHLAADSGNARERAHALVEGAMLGTYAFDRYKREKSEKVVDTLKVITDAGSSDGATRGTREGEVFARAAAFARDLVNAPANDVTPTHLAEVAADVARGSRLKLSTYDRADCERLGMGAFLAVAAGSVQPPKFIHLTYAPSRRPARRIAIIGKGITFDAGGLDLKPPDGMLRMKNDMAGAAAVLAVMRALPDLAPAVEVHGLVAATENMPSGSAFRPGDVLRAMNGTTIEIGNTDAEGRLTLADALAYAAARIKPDEAIDVATLTGACVIALGPLCSGLMANDQALADRVLAAGAAAGERVWQLPLIDEYRDHLKSDVADLNNVGPRGGGAINAGLFLKEFATGMRWAHLDIAGSAFTDKDLPVAPKGATGVPVRTLLTYLTGTMPEPTEPSAPPSGSRARTRPRRASGRRTRP
jgi:leucyl aminopeptidase